jgi:hypothetical protein
MDVQIVPVRIVGIYDRDPKKYPKVKARVGAVMGSMVPLAMLMVAVMMPIVPILGHGWHRHTQ